MRSKANLTRNDDPPDASTLASLVANKAASTGRFMRRSEPQVLGVGCVQVYKPIMSLKWGVPQRYNYRYRYKYRYIYIYHISPLENKGISKIDGWFR